jgi:endonuclease/exonuclease/phosphatase family metal-dependent hydrolase
MRLATYNIQYSRGKDEHFDIARVVAAVKDADVIALQEVERFWPRSGMVDQPAEIAALLPQHYSVYAPFFDVHAGVNERAEPRDNRRRQFGTMLLSKRPIQWSRSHHFRKIATYNRFNMDTGALEVLIETNIGPLRFFSLHLSALDVRERLLQAESLLAINERARLDGPPWTGPPTTGGDAQWSANSPPPQTSTDAVLMGDFNSEPHDAVYELLVGPKDENTGRIHKVDSFVDTWAIVHNEEVGEATWIRPPNYPATGDQRLDYCFVSPPLVGRVLNAWVDSEAQGSDHQPYWVEMDI